MASAFRCASRWAIQTIHINWERQSHETVSYKPQLLKRKESWSGLELTCVCLPAYNYIESLTAQPNQLTSDGFYAWEDILPGLSRSPQLGSHHLLQDASLAASPWRVVSFLFLFFPSGWRSLGRGCSIIEEMINCLSGLLCSLRLEWSKLSPTKDAVLSFFLCFSITGFLCVWAC